MNGAREVPAMVALSIASGLMLCDFSDMHESIEFLTGGPVWTHELANRDFVALLSRDVLRQAPVLATVDTSNVTPRNAQSEIERLRAALPATVTLAPIPDYGRTAGPVETLAAALGSPGPR